DPNLRNARIIPVRIGVGSFWIGSQESILNPSLVGRGTGDSTRTFSEDCVCVVAKGPNMPDLYFYDIPGLIHGVGDSGDPTQIDLIKRLITKYVKKPNCIVLLVVSCEYDLEIGGVAPIIFDSDVDAKARTVGVLTKVDRMADGMEPTWLETFNNNGPHKLDNGWFAVKLPSRDHIPWETARQQEREWFENNNLWESEDRNRMGSEQLTQYISRLLSNLVADRLPAISRKITEIIDDCDRDIQRLPRNTERNAQYTVTNAIGKFTADLSVHIDPGILPKPFTTEVGLVYHVNGLYDTMRHGVSEKTPRFCPTTKSKGGALPGSSPAWDQLCAKGEIVYLDQVMEYMKLASRSMRLLPGELPYKIVPHIITDVVRSWQDIVINGFHKIRAKAIEHLNVLVRTHFAEYVGGGLSASVQEILDENIDHCGDDTVVELDRLAARELAPSTVLKAEYSVLQTTICQQYRHALAPDSAPEASLLSVTADLFKAFILKNNTSIAGELAAGVISAATQQSFLDHIATASRQGGDSHAVYGATADKDLNNALEVMSSVQAYLELASKRFADVATNCIDDSFLRTLYERVDNALRALPFNNSPEMCLQLIQDPTIVEQRRSLKERRIQFAGVYNTLNNAMRDLKREIPDLHVRTQSQSAAPEPQAQDNSDSEASFAQVSVDSSNSK
ncbi:hypothetical protein B0H11DRAFT_2098441, partial [Mycena galericulata]